MPRQVDETHACRKYACQFQSCLKKVSCTMSTIEDPCVTVSAGSQTRRCVMCCTAWCSGLTSAAAPACHLVLKLAPTCGLLAWRRHRQRSNRVFLFHFRRWASRTCTCVHGRYETSRSAAASTMRWDARAAKPRLDAWGCYDVHGVGIPLRRHAAAMMPVKVGTSSSDGVTAAAAAWGETHTIMHEAQMQGVTCVPGLTLAPPRCHREPHTTEAKTDLDVSKTMNRHWHECRCRCTAHFQSWTRLMTRASLSAGMAMTGGPRPRMRRQLDHRRKGAGLHGRLMFQVQDCSTPMERWKAPR